MQVDLLPGRDCTLSEIVGNLYELKTVHLHETHLILAKMRLPALTTFVFAGGKRRGTSEELIEDLENQLGNCSTPYLTIRLTYEHTGLSNSSCVINPDCGLSTHTTVLRTEATATIRRTPNSDWAPRNVRTSPNTLISLIETHYTGDEARDAIRKLAEERVKLPRARRGDGPSPQEGSSEETVKAAYITSLEAGRDHREPLKSVHPADTVSEIDPARKIWTEMRRTSRSRHHRKSLSEGTYAAPGHNCSPGRISSRGTMDEERNRIKQVALRNKRSVGADTLRSIAPSVAKPKSSSIAEGLGLGRTWGWGASWW